MRKWQFNYRLIISFLCFFLLSPALYSQTAHADVYKHPLGTETMEAFNAVSEQLAEKPVVRGNFEQEKALNRLQRSLKSSGNFIIAAELGMVWDTTKPFPSTLALGKDYMVQSRPGSRKTMLSAEGNETFISLAEVISAVFTGNTRRLLDNFDAFFYGSVNDWKLGLLPRDKAIASFAARITMEGDAAIKSIIINEQNGDSIRYILSNHSFPVELNPHEKSFFTAE